MKLDNIIYDVDSLAAAITEQWNNESEAFKAMYPSDTSTALINIFAGYGSMLQYMLLGAIANCYTTTAFSTAGIYQLAETLGNSLHGNTSSQVTVKIRKRNLLSKLTTIPAKTQFEIRGKKFFNPSAIILPATSSAVEGIVLVQGECLTSTQTTSGIPNEKFYFSNDFKANHDFVKVFVNGEEWNVASSFLEYDKNYITDTTEMNTVVLKTESDGRSCIKVGDNQLAALPVSGTNLLIEYVSNDGVDGNIAELGLEGSLITVVSDIEDTQLVNLDIEITTTSTAFGGANTQSTEVLRYSSPYIFASGHRAIRRQDYIALLLNECGYLTANVWGEYEEAEKIGAYDPLMMNMVYYTGIKSYQQYPPFTVSRVDNDRTTEGSINSTNGFWGSFSITVHNLKNDAAHLIYHDNDAKGLLFINDNEQDPRDSILPIWYSAISLLWKPTIGPIRAGGSGYTLSSDTEEFKIIKVSGGEDTGYVLNASIVTIDSKGAVTGLTLADDNAFPEKLALNTPYSLVRQSGSGTGLQIVFTSFAQTDLSTFIHTNEDNEDSPGAINNYPIRNACSNSQYNNLHYESLNLPTLQQPVQIFIDFTELEGSAYDNLKEGAAITGFKLQASPEVTFPGVISVFATNDTDAFNYSSTNIRNSNLWDKLAPRTALDNPTGNNNDGWTNWIALDTYDPKAETSTDKFKSYKYYVIEIYALSDTNVITSDVVGFKTIKFMMPDDSSTLEYDNNGKFKLQFPTPDSPGPGENEENTIGITTINNDSMPLWSYTAEISEVTAQNNYKNGNVLAYKTDNTTFLVNVVNIDTGVFSVTIDASDILVGKDYIDTEEKASLDESPVYEQIIAENPVVGGTDYQRGEILKLSNGLATRYEDGEPGFEIKVNTDTSAFGDHPVISCSWKYPDNFEKQYGIGVAYVGKFKTLSALTGHDCEVLVSAKTCSGISTPITIENAGSGYQIGDVIRLTNLYTTMWATVCNVDGSGAVTGVKITTSSDTVNAHGTGLVIGLEDLAGHNGKIQVTSDTNLSVTAAFTGNRLDTASTNLFDQPTIKKYNHFTTYLEFQQPTVIPVDIDVQISLVQNTSITSGVILQNVKNALYSLFDLTPDRIGKGLKLSKIYTTIMAVEGVAWCKVITPTSNLDVAINTLMVPGDFTIINVTEA